MDGKEKLLGIVRLREKRGSRQFTYRVQDLPGKQPYVSITLFQRMKRSGEKSIARESA